MAALTWKDRIKVASATTGTGTLTLGAAASGYRTFAAGDDGKLFPYVIEDGTAWETGYGTYTHSGTTFARTTRTDSSTGSAISCTGAENVFVDLIADFASRTQESDLTGLELAYNSTTVLRVKAGTAAVNGSTVNFAQTDYTSGSTMKDIANATVTLAASKHYWVFVSSGGVIGIEINDSTGDGATPVYDSNLDYWKAASTGAAWRRIGSFWTNGSSTIMKFYVASLGRLRRTYLAGTTDCPTLVNGVANASYTSITITPYYTGDMAEMIILATAVNTSTNARSAGVLMSVDGGTSALAYPYVDVNVTGVANSATPYAQVFAPYTGTLHYSTTGLTTNSTITYLYALGFTQYV